ncbi:pimeloyl-ACP methyl ester carboxylesterase [Enterococcus sp. PF1-24]|uniref:alpha/beta fold hydrolase n=1 Tax=unclassified Enterococcus TaxID=2608891 RepID=UPI002473A88D|nr:MULTISPECIES: alpha/beta hydrolase [unclassified Enterococcus]MDH6363055.1 pimeloyl-ACP methyl ester carboxylesterase [Enterococcus sp. PFB1-1]MDH6400149.1 pimeloyl-ACP methyl ester carboxylesterase [Enterococcus sp. PF1-24]
MRKSMKEKIFLNVNNSQQGMFIESKNIENPVLLFLHGGPGTPEIAFNLDNPTGLEDLFTVCWWEQRGSGLSYQKNIAKESMTLEQIIADTIVVTNYLRERFGKEKIYVMGHSWGSLLGIMIIQRKPELFHAYIGIGQVSQQAESERLAYTFMLNEFQNSGNQKMVRKLKQFPIDQGAEISNDYLALRSKGMMDLGIGMMPIMKMILRFKGYTFKEKVRFMQGNSFSVKYLWETVLQMNLIKEVPEVEVPIYIMQGQFDYQVSYALAKEFAKTIKAPLIGFYTFENSAHSPCFEEPEKMRDILCKDVLQNKAALADKL